MDWLRWIKYYLINVNDKHDVEFSMTKTKHPTAIDTRLQDGRTGRYNSRIREDNRHHTDLCEIQRNAPPRHQRKAPSHKR